jgi:hypothetical protein
MMCNLNKIALVATVLLAGCAASAAGGTDDAPVREPVSLTIKSWGKPLFDWTLNPDGTGRYTYSDNEGSTGFHDYRLVTKSISVGPEGHAQIAALLAPGRRFAGGEMPCERRITDMPYGQIGWGDAPAATVKFDLGCRSAQADPVLEGLQKAQDAMMAWAKDAPVIETRRPET